MARVNENQAIQYTEHLRQMLDTEKNAVKDMVHMELRERLGTILENASSIEKQSLLMQQKANQVEKSAKEWENLLHVTSKKLRHFGDLQNWAEQIERDMHLIERTLQIVHECP